MVATIEAHPDFDRMSEGSRLRAVRILVSLAEAAKDHGYAARVDPQCPLGLTVRFGDHESAFSLREEPDREPRLPTVDEQEGSKVYGWQRADNRFSGAYCPLPLDRADRASFRPFSSLFELFPLLYAH
jgi:hypothetical protein